MFMFIELLKFGHGIDQKSERRASWRKALQLHADSVRNYFEIGLRDEYRLLDGELAKQPGIPQWRAHSWVSLGVSPTDWAIRSEHSWYDGEHCCYQFGPLVLHLSGLYAGDCEKGLE